MSTSRIDFYEVEKRVLFTVTLPHPANAIELLEEVIRDCIFSPIGPYSMTIWDIRSGKDVEVHTYTFQQIPKNTSSAFLNAKILFPTLNLENDGIQNKAV